MRILVTGKNGQLGRSLQKIVNANDGKKNSHNQYEFFFVGKEELDLECPKNINDFFNKCKFDIIINCAAYTEVDKAEKNLDTANRINHLAVKQLAEIAMTQKAKMLQISTDYVFEGNSKRKYTENDKAIPINEYGKSKLAGEKVLQEIMVNNAIIIRTSWVYSEWGNNFLKTILMLGQKRQELNVVSDQVGSPTYAGDLAKLLLDLIKNNAFGKNKTKTEIYHYSNEGQTTWYEFAKEIFNIADVNCKLSPVSSTQYPTLARRPKDTTMSKNKISHAFDIKVPAWQDSLRICMNFLNFKNS